MFDDAQSELGGLQSFPQPACSPAHIERLRQIAYCTPFVREIAYVENGQIKYPIKNFRFNESPVIMLNNVEELGKPVRVKGDEADTPIIVPPMKLRDFTFTSLSDAV